MAGGVAAAAAAAGVVGTAAPALALDGLFVAIGVSNNTGSHVTGIVLDTANRNAFQATASGTGNGVNGTSLGTGIGVNGFSTDGTAVQGISTNGEGVHGESTTSNGVSGKSFKNIASGVYGENDAGGYGVAGRSSSGTGIYGETTTGVGIQAQSTGTGRALHVEGRATFKGSGLSPIAVGHRAVTVTPSVAIKPGSMVLCTLESNQPGLAIERVVKNVAAGTITINLVQVVTAAHTAKVAWLVLG
jgi:hypothetical protein